MNQSDWIAFAALAVGVVGPFLAGYVADARSKGRAEVVETATKKALDDLAKDVDSHDARLKTLEISTAVTTNTVAQVGRDIASLRVEMDRRFDQLGDQIDRIGSGSGVHKRIKPGDRNDD